MVVILQLCVSDGVEDLMESLTVESEKSLTSQEPDSHHGVGSTAEHLQGELTSDLGQWTPVRGDQVSAATHPVSPQTPTPDLARTLLSLRLCSRSFLWSTCRSGTSTWR